MSTTISKNTYIHSWFMSNAINSVIALELNVRMFVYFISGRLPLRNSLRSDAGISVPYFEYTVFMNFWNFGVILS